MVQPHDASAALLRSSIYRDRAWLLAGAVLTLCTVAAGPGWPDAPSDRTPESVQSQDAAVPPRLEEPAPASGNTQVALVKPAEAKPPLNSEQQRQLMLLLLMNSAGPVRPFGGFGR